MLFLAFGVVGVIFLPLSPNGEKSNFDSESMKNLNENSLARDAKFGTGSSMANTFPMNGRTPQPDFEMKPPANYQNGAGYYGANYQPGEQPNDSTIGRQDAGNYRGNSTDRNPQSYEPGPYGGSKGNVPDRSTIYTTYGGYGDGQRDTTYGGYGSGQDNAYGAPYNQQQDASRQRARDTLYTQGGYEDEDDTSGAYGSRDRYAKPSQPQPAQQFPSRGPNPGSSATRAEAEAGPYSAVPDSAPLPGPGLPTAGAAKKEPKVRCRTCQEKMPISASSSHVCPGLPGQGEQAQRSKEPPRNGGGGGGGGGGDQGRPAAGKRMKVIKRHKPQLEDEVGLEVGDSVDIEDVFEDGWGVGTNSVTGDYGAFPLACLGGNNKSMKQRVQSMYGGSSNRDTMYTYRS
ncbi:hypothetical protein HK405_010892 [Cladochytrium tenue]|nr:hypothetical protein HK405_010892 [Cladochytrium tenue]